MVLPLHEGPGAGAAGRPVWLPAHGRGMRIGLFGGTFNPPHDGHRLASLIALRRLRLDAVWWLVTPGNPLKENSGLPPLRRRMEAARAVASHPRIAVTGFEADIGTRYTFETLSWLRRRCPGVDFVWIMGADNLAGFHRWQRWTEIAALLPVAVIDRPEATLRAAGGRTAQRFAARRIGENQARLLARQSPPAWIFIHGPRSPLSSTELRARGAGLV
ncbi:MAG: nicotinate-nucleotide adenylyltransferase [Alphaproteobacteria bacterium]|nr:nicotinate-nucleotide adenylyltransferase [Alphaproteobacteria bacterium]